MKNKKNKDEVYSPEDIVAILELLLENDDFPKKKPFPNFNEKETYFLVDLIFNKPKELIFMYLADHLVNNSSLQHLPMLNSPSLRKLRFIFHFLGSKSAKEAAIKAGFSPKTAKQQASRLLRKIQGYKRCC